MSQNPPQGICLVNGKEGNCFNCNLLVEVSETELFNKEFICPECGAENHIELSQIKKINNTDNNKSIVENDEGVCINCNTLVELNEQELSEGKFICPECGTENFITLKYDEWKKWLPAIPISLAIIALYFFGRINDVMTFKTSMAEFGSDYNGIFVNIVVFIRVIALMFLIFIIYLYFKKKESLKFIFNLYVVFIIIALAASTFLIYLSLYSLYSTPSMITSGRTDWDLITEALKFAGKDKIQTFTETVYTIIFLLVYWRAGNYYLSKVEAK